VRVVLYSRASCHLCDVAREILLAELSRAPFELEEVDIDRDDDLVREYGLRVPVVTIDGDERFEYEVDPSELRRLVEAG